MPISRYHYRPFPVLSRPSGVHLPHYLLLPHVVISAKQGLSVTQHDGEMREEMGNLRKI